MSDENVRDIKIALTITVAVILLLMIGWLWGIKSASSAACHNLGYDTGYYSGPVWDATIVCESSHKMAIPDMGIAP